LNGYRSPAAGSTASTSTELLPETIVRILGQAGSEVRSYVRSRMNQVLSPVQWSRRIGHVAATGTSGLAITTPLVGIP
jgi:hypothetical protein